MWVGHRLSGTTPHGGGRAKQGVPASTLQVIYDRNAKFSEPTRSVGNQSGRNKCYHILSTSSSDRTGATFYKIFKKSSLDILEISA